MIEMSEITVNAEDIAAEAEAEAGEGEEEAMQRVLRQEDDGTAPGRADNDSHDDEVSRFKRLIGDLEI